MDDAVAPYLNAFVYLHAGVDDGAVANLAVVAYACVGVYLHVVAYLCVAAYDGIGAHIAALAYLAATTYVAAAGTPSGGLGALVEGVQQQGHSNVGVVHAYEGRANGVLWNEVLAHNDYRGLLLVDVMRVFGVAEEGDTAFAAFFNLARFPHLDILVALDGAVHHTGQFFCCQLHTVQSSNSITPRWWIICMFSIRWSLTKPSPSVMRLPFLARTGCSE